MVLALLLVTSAAVYLSYGDDVDLRDLVDTRVPADYVPPKTKGKVRLGIVLKTKDPIAIHDWLRHHQNLGVERVYMRIEDTPGLAAEMNKSEFANMLSISVKPPSGPKVKYKNVFNKYVLVDRHDELRGADLKLRLVWDIMPLSGRLFMHSRDSRTNFKLPGEYI